VGQRYIAQRLRTDPKRFPRPGEGYGDLRVSGWVTIRAIDEFNALAQIDAACDSIEIGDLLEPYVESQLPTSATAPHYPDFSDRANVLFGTDNRVLFGDGDVFSIDRGTAQGVAAATATRFTATSATPPAHRTAMQGSMKYGAHVTATSCRCVYMGDVVRLDRAGARRPRWS
jgi:hypothetical protein